MVAAVRRRKLERGRGLQIGDRRRPNNPCSDAYGANQEIIQKLDDENEALRAGTVSGMAKAKEIGALKELLESITTQAEEKRGL